MAKTETELVAYADSHRERLVEITRDLVRIPSENRAPDGAEGPCQRYVAEFLRDLGLQPEIYDLAGVPALKEHPLYWPGRNYKGRPNVDARVKGTGDNVAQRSASQSAAQRSASQSAAQRSASQSGRSLILSGHIDTVPRGTQPWTRDAFGGAVEGNRLYGRGANDMKAGVAANLFVLEALHATGTKLKGDVIFETVADEEFGGVNGTIAGRLKGYTADAAVITEPTFLRICPAQRGGRIAHIQLKAPGGILSESEFPRGVIDQLRHFLVAVREFAEQRKRGAGQHELYVGYSDPVPVSITKVHTSPWGTGEPVTIPETCLIEMYWQLSPGETQAAVDREFLDWLDRLPATAPDLFPARPEVTFPIRWLPGSAIAKNHPVVEAFSRCAAEALGERRPVQGFEAPCDMFAFHHFGIPAFLWGPSGENTHAADEYVDLDSVVATAKALLNFVACWCG